MIHLPENAIPISLENAPWFCDACQYGLYNAVGMDFDCPVTCDVKAESDEWEAWDYIVFEATRHIREAQLKGAQCPQS